ncbi:MAG TPA: Gfo/Idh/MocA family oxidoreductase [Planctomycetota bacterium]|nr:Gfo/Idh/MocA family oxidoreductase [Planctomycetota bacterium]
MPNQQFTFAIIGAGGRGNCFSQWIHDNPDAGKVIAVAEPNPERRENIVKRHGIKPEMAFERWEDLLAKPKLADVLINTTMDRMHIQTAIPALDKGYHMLLEKPMAVTLEDCKAIDEARRRNNRIVSICHGMRHHVIWAELKRQLDSGVIGKIVSYDQLEAVEHIHQSHSFVRGNWGNEGRSTFMLLAKSCHDMDIIAYLIGKPCQRVSSFGTLSYFRKENAPPGAPERCVDGCPAEQSCPYSTYKVYTGKHPHWGAWHAGLAEKPFEKQIEILKTSNYGKCVFRCDNDVVDHQIVALEFAEGITATFTMTAFTPYGGRFVRVHGTHGLIRVSEMKNEIEIHNFESGKINRIALPVQHGSHAGADDNIMKNFVYSLRQNDNNKVLTSTAESLRTHKIAFAAERARREKRVVELEELG